MLSEDTVKNLLNLLRRIIENANKTKTVKDIYDWDTTDCEFDKPIKIDSPIKKWPILNSLMPLI